MRGAIILGSGRSGTSMLAGTLARSGYFMGDQMLRAREANPKGFFEDVGINRLNEDLLWPLIPRRPPLLGRWIGRDRPLRRQLWVARVPVEVEVSCPPPLVEAIRDYTRRSPFCYKDPRFCYTLPAWRPHLGDAAFLVVFRDPSRTAASILRERETARYMQSLSLGLEEAVEAWTLMYRHVLERHRREGDWLFLHFDQVVSGAGLDAVATLLDARVDRDFPDQRLQRSQPDHDVGAAARDVYRELCELARVSP